MHTITKNENSPACTVALSHSLVVPKIQFGGRSPSPSPSPAPIRKYRPLQPLNSNQVSQRALGDSKENQRSNHILQRSGVRADQSAVILQPPIEFSRPPEVSQSQSALYPLVSKPPTRQVQLGLIPLSTQWNPNNNCVHPGRVGHIENLQCNTANFSSYTGEEMEGPEVDPFAQLSARTLALMDQPESEVTIYDCEYCDKTYQGKHARSIWRRHLSDKHKIPLSTQPRRTRWDNDANRPKTEEERRERTLESKRRWARKNRAAKKAARDGQRNSIDQTSGTNNSESAPSEHYRGSPNRSRAPSPSSFPAALVHNSTGPLSFSATAQFARSQSTQGEHFGHVSMMTRPSSVPHTFTPYPSMGSRASISLGNSSYNPSFGMSQVVPAPEWSLPMPPLQTPSPYLIESITSSAHSPGQFSDRFTIECLQQNHSPRIFHNLSRRHSLATYATEITAEQVDEKGDMAEGYTGASLTSQYGDWDLDGRFNSLPIGLAQPESSSCEAHFKRSRLSHSSSMSVPLQKFDDLRKSYSTCHLDSSADNSDFQTIGMQNSTESSLFSGSVPQRNFQNSPPRSALDEEADSELGAIAEEPPSHADGENNLRPSLHLSIHSRNRVDEAQSARPATSGTLSSMSHENELNPVIPTNRAATEPQFATRYDLQTPNHSTPSLYHGHYAPISTGKRVMPENVLIHPFTTPGSGMADWNSHLLDTPSGYSRVPFNNNVLVSPERSIVPYGSPNSNLSKSLGLTLNSSVSGEDCIGGLLGSAASRWDTVHQST